MADLSPSRANPFWDFSLALYASPDVQRACIELQDGDGVDVNVMLFVLYLASLGQQISPAEARAVRASVEAWRIDVVTPLRTARRNLKTPALAIDPPGALALRAIVKKAELEAERLQQAALFAQSDTLGTTAEPLPAAGANLDAYGAALFADGSGRQLATGPVGVMLSAYERLLANSAGGRERRELTR